MNETNATSAANSDSTLDVSEPHRLIAEGQALVRSLASRIQRSVPVKVDLEDLIAYGEVGLAESARDFDPNHGTQFSTFAYYRIQGAIYDGLAKMTWTSRSRYKRLRYEQMAAETLERESAENLGKDSLSAHGNWFGRVNEKLAVVFLASGDADGQANVTEGVEDPSESAPQLVLHREASDRLRQLVDQLPNEERRLVCMVYFEGKTLQEASSQMGISKSWASRLHSRILERLAGQLRRLDLHD